MTNYSKKYRNKCYSKENVLVRETFLFCSHCLRMAHQSRRDCIKNFRHQQNDENKTVGNIRLKREILKQVCLLLSCLEQRITFGKMPTLLKPWNSFLKSVIIFNCIKRDRWIIFLVLRFSVYFVTPKTQVRQKRWNSSNWKQGTFKSHNWQVFSKKDITKLL